MIAFNTQSGRYSVISHGNGWAYEITDNETADNLWFQDSDAIQLQEESNNFEHEFVIAQYFDCLCD